MWIRILPFQRKFISGSYPFKENVDPDPTLSKKIYIRILPFREIVDPDFFISKIFLLAVSVEKELKSLIIWYLCQYLKLEDPASSKTYSSSIMKGYILCLVTDAVCRESRIWRRKTYFCNLNAKCDIFVRRGRYGVVQKIYSIQRQIQMNIERYSREFTECPKIYHISA